MKLLVLGAAAGGGFPQWNCNCANCSAVRSGSPHHQARTQSSVAVGGPHDWLLINTSPDILTQIQRNPQLQPARGLRDTGIAGVMLVDAQIDHSTGLFMLRERGRPLPLWCTDPTAQDLSGGNPILPLLGHYCGVARHELPIDGRNVRPYAVLADDAQVSGRPDPSDLATLQVRALALDSQPPPYSPRRGQPVEGDNIGLVFENSATGRRIFYAPGLSEISPPVWQAMSSADVVMVDGTFWTDDEMIRLGLSKKTAKAIGHLAQSGPEGMLSWLAKLPRSTRKLLIHINNTNPVLDASSPERAALDAAGVELAVDGMEIAL
jgi:pyrroloquinoline quinone biosynthesis protein B